MQRQVKRRIERAEKTKIKAAANKPIDKKWIFLAIGVVAAIVAIVTSVAAFQNFDRAVARIDGTTIRASALGHELWNAEQELSEEYFAMFPGDWAIDYDRPFRDNMTFGDVIRREAAINLAVAVLLEAEAERLGVALTDDERRDIQREIVEGWANDFSPLYAMGIRNRQQLTDVLERMQTRNKVFDAMLVDLDPMQVFAKGIELDVIWAAQHILVGFEERTVDEAHELAEALLERIHAGEDFEELMLMYSDDQDPDEPPDLYTFTSGVMVTEFEEGTRALAIGEISGLVRSMWGYHIIKRAEPYPDPFGVMGDLTSAIGNVLVEQIYKDARERIQFLPALGRVELGLFD